MRRTTPRLLYRCTLVGLAVLALAACSAFTPTPAPRGEVRSAPTQPTELGQSDVNRLATLGMRDNLESLTRLMDKLYRRNPAEWRKTSAVSREDAMAHVRAAIDKREPWPTVRATRSVVPPGV